MDGVVALERALDPGWSPGPIDLRLGITYVTSSAGLWRVRYDNVTVAVEPAVP